MDLQELLKMLGMGPSRWESQTNRLAEWLENNKDNADIPHIVYGKVLVDLNVLSFHEDELFRPEHDGAVESCLTNDLGYIKNELGDTHELVDLLITIRDEVVEELNDDADADDDDDDDDDDDLDDYDYLDVDEYYDDEYDEDDEDDESEDK